MKEEKKNGYVIRAERTRKKILDAAREVFKENGFRNTTITLIAEKAEVGYGTVYSHFNNGKDEVLMNIMEDIMDDFYQVASVAYTPSTKEDALEFTKKNISGFLELAIIHKEWLALFYKAFGHSEIVLNRWEEITERFIERISKNVDLVKERGLSRNPNYNSRIVAGSLYYPGEKFLWKIVLGNTTQDHTEIARNIAEIYNFGLYK